MNLRSSKNLYHILLVFFICQTISFGTLGEATAFSIGNQYADSTDEAEDFFMAYDTISPYLESDSSYSDFYEAADTTDYFEYEVGEEGEQTWIVVRAYLIYDDNKVSSTDLISNEVALWNTIIGGGDSGGPSHRMKIVLNGMASGFKLDIRNGKRIALVRENLDLDGEMEFMIEDTGCEQVNILVYFQDSSVFTEKVNFMCGE
ncbi:MAG: hypothetical protein ACKOKF_06550 [Bacteroidota bacterium]